MKKNSQIIFAISAALILAVLIFADTRTSKPAVEEAGVPTAGSLAQAGDACPRMMAEDSNYSIHLQDCALDPTYQPSEQIYIAKTLSIKSKHDDSERNYSGSFSFSADPNAGLHYQLLENADNTYLFIDSGTSLVHGISVFALTGEPRTTNLEYIGGMFPPVLTLNGYLVYQDRSDAYPNAHPDIEVSAAMDVHALKLSDFSDKILYAGNNTVDYSTRLTEFEAGLRDEGRFIVESKEKDVMIVKTTWTGATGDPQTLIVPITDL